MCVSEIDSDIRTDFVLPIHAVCIKKSTARLSPQPEKTIQLCSCLNEQRRARKREWEPKTPPFRKMFQKNLTSRKRPCNYLVRRYNQLFALKPLSYKSSKLLVPNRQYPTIQDLHAHNIVLPPRGRPSPHHNREEVLSPHSSTSTFPPACYRFLLRPATACYRSGRRHDPLSRPAPASAEPACSRSRTPLSRLAPGTLLPLQVQGASAPGTLLPLQALCFCSHSAS